MAPSSNRRRRLAVAGMRKPGIVVDENPSYGETGDAFGYDRMFADYNNGKVFLPHEERIKDYKDMLDTDGKAASIEKLLTYPIIAAPKEIKGTKGDKGQAEFCQELFFNSNEYNDGLETPIDLVIAQMNFAQTITRTYFEKVWDVRERDGANILKKVAWRPPETCELALNAKSSEIIGFRQYPTDYFLGSKYGMGGNGNYDQSWKFYGRRKAFMYIHGLWRDPIDGFSAMKVPFWCWSTKRKIRYLWYQYLETTALPKTIVRNQDDDQAKADARKVALLRSRDVLGLSIDTEVEAYESAGHGATQFIEAIRWLESEMSNSVLGGFMDLTSSAASGKGSYALSSDQSRLFLRTRRVVARDMARQITHQLMGDLVRYNFGNDAAIPQFNFGPLDEASEENVLELFSTITTTSGAKEMPKEFLQQLTIRVATILELDPDKIVPIFEEMNKNIDPDDEMGLVVGSVDAAAKMVQAQQNGQNPLEVTKDDPSIPAPPKETNAK